MAIYVYTQTGLPTAIPAFFPFDSSLNVTDDIRVDDILCTIDITPPMGDPTSLFVRLFSPGFGINVTLHNGTSFALSPAVTYDTTRSPAVGSMNDFNGLS